MLAALLLASPVSGGAQAERPATVYPVQSLSFGLLIPGVTEVVAPTDVARRAMVALAGMGMVDITLVLPPSLTTRDGSSIPLLFRSGDEGLLDSPGAAMQPLDPVRVNRVRLRADRTAYLVLGGSAIPSRSQRPGDYTARVLVIVSPPGT